jgi:hypothetical protein
MEVRDRSRSHVRDSPDPLNFLEGDEVLEVDGIVSRGIGAEDYFGGGWYFLDGAFSSPLPRSCTSKRTPTRHRELHVLHGTRLCERCRVASMTFMKA